MAEYTQQKRLIAVKTPLGEDVLLLESFRAREQLSRLFSFELGLLSEQDDIAPEDIVGKSVSVRLALSEDGAARHFHGFVRRFSGEALATRHLRRYRAEIVPWLWFLKRTNDCRIFQNQTVPQIIEDIFSDHGLADFDTGGIQGDHPERVYCTQYRESDFDFVSRLMEEEGIFYYFRHEEDKHTMVLADGTSAYKDCEENEIEFTQGSLVARHISSWEHQYEFRSGKWALQDYNFETPSTSLLVNTDTLVDLPSVDKYEVYDYPGEYGDKGEGDSLSKLRMEEEEVGFDRVQGASNCRSLYAGGKFTLTRHECPAEESKSYVITGVEHSAHESSYSENGGGLSDYSNSFGCVPAEVSFRPERQTHSPVIRGLQTAVVVGPSGEEIHTDEYGRIKVQFHWDRYGKSDENSSCWIRVAQGWAGKTWGSVFLPRIGQEVVVAFLEGDPDQPLVISSVYNAEQMPPYGLPSNKTQSGVKSRSTKGGGGANFNEFRFEDKKGSEQVYLHAEKNMDGVIENDETRSIGNNRTKTVGNDEVVDIGANRTETVGQNETITIGQNRTELVNINELITVGMSRERAVGVHETIGIGANRSKKVGNDEDISIGNNEDISIGSNRSEKIGKNQSLEVGENQTEQIGKDETVSVGVNRTHQIGEDDTLSVGKNLSVDAGDQITIKTGSASIVMKKNGDITINGAKITIKGSGNVIIKGQKILEN